MNHDLSRCTSFRNRSRGSRWSKVVLQTAIRSQCTRCYVQLIVLRLLQLVLCLSSFAHIYSFLRARIAGSTSHTPRPLGKPGTLHTKPCSWEERRITLLILRKPLNPETRKGSGFTVYAIAASHNQYISAPRREGAASDTSRPKSPSNGKIDSAQFPPKAQAIREGVCTERISWVGCRWGPARGCAEALSGWRPSQVDAGRSLAQGPCRQHSHRGRLAPQEHHDQPSRVGVQSFVAGYCAARSATSRHRTTQTGPRLPSCGGGDNNAAMVSSCGGNDAMVGCSPCYS